MKTGDCDEGSIAPSSGLNVANRTFVGGTGTLPATEIAGGGTLAPGNTIGSIAMQGNLAFNAGDIYAVEFSSNHDRPNPRNRNGDVVTERFRLN